jgi:hypothetical protein
MLYLPSRSKEPSAPFEGISMEMTFTLITFTATGLDASAVAPCPHRVRRAAAVNGYGAALDGRHAS